MSALTHEQPGLALTPAEEELVRQVTVEVRQRLMEEPRYGRAELRSRAEHLAREHLQRRFLPRSDEDRVATAVTWEIAGFGPLEVFLADESITDVLVNGADQVFIRRGSEYVPTQVRFRSEKHLREVIDRIIEPLGRSLDESTPFVDGRLPDGHRVHAVIPPLSRGGTCLSVRLFRRCRWQLAELAAAGMFSEGMARFLTAAVQGRASMVISGGTGAGKTTLLAALAALVPGGERLLVVEDSAELVIPHPHVVYLETRVPNAEGRGEVTLWELVRHALRMAPTRILVGEVRGPEALALLDAINTGHEGSLATVHANSPAHALDRLASLVVRALPALPPAAIRAQMMGCLDFVVQVRHCADGVRRVAEVAEVVPDPAAGNLGLHTVFAWRDGRLAVAADPPRAWGQWVRVGLVDGEWPGSQGGA